VIKHKGELKEELKEALLKFTHYRIVTYWWSFALTLISFFYPAESVSYFKQNK
jgi:hypothetical protein